MDDLLPKLLTPEQVAKMLSIHPQTVRKYARTGKIVGVVKVGSEWRFNRAKILKFMGESVPR